MDNSFQKVWDQSPGGDLIRRSWKQNPTYTMHENDPYDMIKIPTGPRLPCVGDLKIITSLVEAIGYNEVISLLTDIL